MRQRTKNHRNQGSIDKNIRFFSKSQRHISRWVSFVQKTQLKNFHAWAPLTLEKPYCLCLYVTNVDYVKNVDILRYQKLDTLRGLGPNSWTKSRQKS
jgi:hypothetical protein